MRLEARGLSREHLLESMDTLSLIEDYPKDKCLPSHLCRGLARGEVFHVLLAADVGGECIHVVTMYRPDPEIWDKELRARR